jgi:hypothetical protein
MNTFKFRLIGTVDMVVTIEAEDAETASGLAYDYPSEKLKWLNWEVEEVEEKPDAMVDDKEGTATVRI